MNSGDSLSQTSEIVLCPMSHTLLCPVPWQAWMQLQSASQVKLLTQPWRESTVSREDFHGTILPQSFQLNLHHSHIIIFSVRYLIMGLDVDLRKGHSRRAPCGQQLPSWVALCASVYVAQHVSLGEGTTVWPPVSPEVVLRIQNFLLLYVGLDPKYPAKAATSIQRHQP